MKECHKNEVNERVEYIHIDPKEGNCERKTSGVFEPTMRQVPILEAFHQDAIGGERVKRRKKRRVGRREILKDVMPPEKSKRE